MSDRNEKTVETKVSTRKAWSRPRVRATVPANRTRGGYNPGKFEEAFYHLS